MAQSGSETFGPDSLEDWVFMRSGGFGLVYKAKHKDLGINMVIKLLDTDDGSGKLYAALCREAAYMEAAENQYVPRVYGMYRGPVPDLGPKKRRGIVMELMEGGSLLSFQQTLSKTPPWPLAFRLAHQVALAMDFLQSKRDLVHMDLKPANILLDANFNAKIADFGLSTVSNSVKSTDGENKGGTLAYTPPEAFGDEYRRVRSYDVYSYGILLWTILTGESPYPGAAPSVLAFRIPKGDRPDLHKIAVLKAAGLEDLVDLMKRCWDPEPNKRPSFGECVEVTRGVFAIHEEGIEAAVSDIKQLLVVLCVSMYPGLWAVGVQLHATFTGSYLPGHHSVLLLNCPNEQAAKDIGRVIMERKMAASINILPKTSTMYYWKGEVQDATEILMLVKTKTSRIQKIMDYVRSVHPYENPELLSFLVQEGSVAYMKWMDEAIPDD